jgi:hypothetical protein
MTCSFCGSPAAHPATGCVYGPRTLACASCVRECWAWVRQHVNRKARRPRDAQPSEFRPTITFYEAAAKNPPKPR